MERNKESDAPSSFEDGTDNRLEDEACEESTSSSLSRSRRVREQFDSIKTKTGTQLKMLHNKLSAWRKENRSEARESTARKEESEAQPSKLEGTAPAGNNLWHQALELGQHRRACQQKQNPAPPESGALQVHKQIYETESQSSQGNPLLQLKVDQQPADSKLKTAQWVLEDCASPPDAFAPFKAGVLPSAAPLPPPRLPPMNTAMQTTHDIISELRPKVPPRAHTPNPETNNGRQQMPQPDPIESSSVPINPRSDMIPPQKGIYENLKSQSLSHNDPQSTSSLERVTIVKESSDLSTVHYSALLTDNKGHSELNEENPDFKTMSSLQKNLDTEAWVTAVTPTMQTLISCQIKSNIINTGQEKHSCPQTQSQTKSQNSCVEDEATSGVNIPLTIDQVSSEYNSHPVIDVECLGSKNESAPSRVVISNSRHNRTSAEPLPQASEQTPLKPGNPPQPQSPGHGSSKLSRTATVGGRTSPKPLAALLVSASKLDQRRQEASSNQRVSKTSPSAPPPEFANEKIPHDYKQVEPRRSLYPQRPAPQPPPSGPKKSHYRGPMRGYSVPAPPLREVYYPPPLPLPPSRLPPAPPVPPLPPRYMYYDREPRPYMPTTEPLPPKDSGRFFFDFSRSAREEKAARPPSAEQRAAGPGFTSALGSLFSSMRWKSSDLTGDMRRQFSTLSASTAASHDSELGSPVDRRARGRPGSVVSGAWIYTAPRTRSEDNTEHDRKGDEPECIAGDFYRWLLPHMTCCCCWPIGLASWALAATILRGRKGPAEVCIQTTAQQLSWYALLAGIAFYFLFLLFFLSLITVSVRKS